MPPDLPLLLTLIGSNYPCLELIFMVPKVLEPLKFDCSLYGTYETLWLKMFSEIGTWVHYINLV